MWRKGRPGRIAVRVSCRRSRLALAQAVWPVAEVAPAHHGSPCFRLVSRDVQACPTAALLPFRCSRTCDPITRPPVQRAEGAPCAGRFADVLGCISRITSRAALARAALLAALALLAIGLGVLYAKELALLTSSLRCPEHGACPRAAEHTRAKNMDGARAHGAAAGLRLGPARALGSALRATLCFSQRGARRWKGHQSRRATRAPAGVSITDAHARGAPYLCGAPLQSVITRKWDAR
jgi:hypothetical protein